MNDDKAFPGTITIPNTAQDQWTTRALTRSSWKDGVPKYTLLWLSEPDKSQHDASPGSANALAGIDLGLFRWKQYLQTSDVNGTVYFDSGNGEASPK